MRIAVAGKGGAGKTTITATAARLVARSGRCVVAIDADTNPNLAPAMGFDPVKVSAVPILATSIISLTMLMCWPASSAILRRCSSVTSVRVSAGCAAMVSL